MVTTRSADKRVDARDEDLVLRSRTVASPGSQDPTPSRTRKRNNNSDEATPVTKRTRTLISVEISLPRPATSVSSHSAAQDDDNIVVATNTNEEEGADLVDEASKFIDAAESEPTPKQREVFQTPATSRHKRFDSTDPEDTIIVNRDISSNSQQGYETAEETIEDSDEAPEITSTKTPSRQSQNIQSSRASRRKGRARASDFFAHAREDKAAFEEAIPESAETTVQVQKGPESLDGPPLDAGKIPESKSDNSETKITPDVQDVAVDNTPLLEDLIRQEQEHENETGLVVASGVLAELPTSTTDAGVETASTENATTTTPGPLSSTAQSSISPFRSGTNQGRQVTVLNTNISLRPNPSSAARQDSFTDTVARNHSLDFRLPDPVKSSRSRFVRQKLDSRGINLQSTWPTKRRAFVTS